MNIKPGEITDILKREIKEYDREIDVAETGTVLSAGDGIARVYGLENVLAGELVEFNDGLRGQRLCLRFSARKLQEADSGTVRNKRNTSKPSTEGGTDSSFTVALYTSSELNFARRQSSDRSSRETAQKTVPVGENRYYFIDIS